MKPDHRKLGDFIKTHGSVVRFSEILRAGYHPDTIRKLLLAGVIEKIGRGIYRPSGTGGSETPDLVDACQQVPGGVVCLISALSFHGATQIVPGHVDMAIQRGTRARKIAYPPVKYYRFDSGSWGAGIETQGTGAEKIRVYSLAKTVADCFKFRSGIGRDIAASALRTALIDNGVKPDEIIKFARICRVEKVIRPVMEAMLWKNS